MLIQSPLAPRPSPLSSFPEHKAPWRWFMNHDPRRFDRSPQRPANPSRTALSSAQRPRCTCGCSGNARKRLETLAAVIGTAVAGESTKEVIIAAQRRKRAGERLLEAQQQQQQHKPLRVAERAGTSPVDAVVRETIIMERQVHFQSATENGPAFCECFVRTNKHTAKCRPSCGCGLTRGSRLPRRSRQCRSRRSPSRPGCVSPWKGISQGSA